MVHGGEMDRALAPRVDSETSARACFLLRPPHPLFGALSSKTLTGPRAGTAAAPIASCDVYIRRQGARGAPAFEEVHSVGMTETEVDVVQMPRSSCWGEARERRRPPRGDSHSATRTPQCRVCMRPDGSICHPSLRPGNREDDAYAYSKGDQQPSTWERCAGLGECTRMDADRAMVGRCKLARNLRARR